MLLIANIRDQGELEGRRSKEGKREIAREHVWVASLQLALFINYECCACVCVCTIFAQTIVLTSSSLCSKIEQLQAASACSRNMHSVYSMYLHYECGHFKIGYCIL